VPPESNPRVHVIAPFKRHLNHLRVRNHLSDAGLRAVHQRSPGLDADRLRQLPDLHCEVERRMLVHLQDNTGPLEGPKSTLLRGDHVIAWCEQPDRVVTKIIRCGISRNIGSRVSHGHFYTRDDSAGVSATRPVICASWAKAMQVAIRARTTNFVNENSGMCVSLQNSVINSKWYCPYLNIRKKTYEANGSRACIHLLGARMPAFQAWFVYRGIFPMGTEDELINVILARPVRASSLSEDR